MIKTKIKKTGILLCNLGTPQEPTLREIKKFLGEFLMDKRVISLPYLLRFLLVYGIILPTRVKKLVAVYQSVWTDNGSPLLSINNLLAQKLENYLNNNFKVLLAMRYGKPSISQALEIFKSLEITPENIIILPLYPQYSLTTTESVFDCFNSLPLHIQNYHDHPLYIQALADSVREYQAQHGKPDLLIISFHGLPEINIQKGDPYLKQAQRTSELLAQALNLKNSEWRLTFQSRVGAQKWLTPYTDQVLKNLPKENIFSIQVICPGFSIDCIETLEEIDIRNREFFLESGGKKFGYIPCLNNQDSHVNLLGALCVAQNNKKYL